jgi:hypothetical protein
MPLAFAAGTATLAGDRSEHSRRARAEPTTALFRGNCQPDPGRLPPARPRFRNRGRFARVHSTFARAHLAPLSPGRVMPLRQHRETAGPCYPHLVKATLRRPSARDEKMLLTSFCNRSQLRAPVDRSTPARRLSPRGAAARIVARTAPRPPCGISATGELTLDGVSPTSAPSYLARPRARPALAGDRAAAFSTACVVEEKPLTLPFAPWRQAVSRAAPEH